LARYPFSGLSAHEQNRIYLVNNIIYLFDYIIYLNVKSKLKMRIASHSGIRTGGDPIPRPERKSAASPQIPAANGRQGRGTIGKNRQCTFSLRFHCIQFSHSQIEIRHAAMLTHNKIALALGGRDAISLQKLRKTPAS
jgi:hypothetical protein